MEPSNNKTVEIEASNNKTVEIEVSRYREWQIYAVMCQQILYMWPSYKGIDDNELNNDDRVIRDFQDSVRTGMLHLLESAGVDTRRYNNTN